MPEHALGGTGTDLQQTVPEAHVPIPVVLPAGHVPEAAGWSHELPVVLVQVYGSTRLLGAQHLLLLLPQLFVLVTA